MRSYRFWYLAFFLGIVCLTMSSCAEFFEDYQYNPAGPLYTSSSNY